VYSLSGLLVCSTATVSACRGPLGHWLRCPKSPTAYHSPLETEEGNRVSCLQGGEWQRIGRSLARDGRTTVWRGIQPHTVQHSSSSSSSWCRQTGSSRAAAAADTRQTLAAYSRAKRPKQQPADSGTAAAGVKVTRPKRQPASAGRQEQEQWQTSAVLAA
jgi:hypothetical protein